MYRYADYCPLAATTDVLGDYWTPLIVRELLYGTNHFNQLVRNLPEISRSLLSSRLRALERANIVERKTGTGANQTEYRLTPAGRDLSEVLDAMNRWGSRWGISVQDPAHESGNEPREREVFDMHPMGAICMLKSRVRVSQLPSRRIVMEIHVAAADQEARAWILCEHGGASLCATPPPYDVDINVRSDNLTLYRFWRQQVTMADALRCRAVQVDGKRELMGAFPSWFDAAVTSAVA